MSLQCQRVLVRSLYVSFPPSVEMCFLNEFRQKWLRFKMRFEATFGAL